MHALRTTRNLARLLLVWFALFLGATVAAPLVAPQSLEIICSGTGMTKVLVKSVDGTVETPSSAAMDCPLCAPGGVPPTPAVALEVRPAQPLAYALRSIPAARIAALTSAPLPARGPPSL